MNVKYHAHVLKLAKQLEQIYLDTEVINFSEKISTI